MKTQDKAKWLADYWLQVADGGVMQSHQYIPAKITELDWHDSSDGPNMLSNPEHWRIKPRLIPVDMSVLVDSGIDCEFYHGDSERVIGKLCGVGDTYDGIYRRSLGRGCVAHSHCQPRMNHVHVWLGGDRPLPDGVMVKVWTRGGGGDSGGGQCSARTWHHSNNVGDIVAFEVLGLAPGYCWPWEQSSTDPRT